VKTDPISIQRFFGYVFIAVAIFAGVIGCFSFCGSQIFSSDQMGSLVFLDCSKRLAIAAFTMACLGTYCLKYRMKVNKGAPRLA